MTTPNENALAPSPLDLTTVADFKAWQGSIPSTNTDEDSLIQGCITAFGAEFLWRTGLGDQNSDMQQSPFNGVCDFNETYDGKGGYRMFPNNRPIQTVSSLVINGIQIQQSSGYNQQGFVIDGTGKSIALRSALSGWAAWNGFSWPAGPYRSLGGGLRFWTGIQNVNLVYTAGYANTPLDIVEAANIAVLVNYKRRKYTDEASRAMANGGGTIRYRDWSLPPEVMQVVEAYSRTL